MYVVVEIIKGRIASVDKELINFNECTGSITFAEPPIKLKPVVETPEVDLSYIGIPDVEIFEVIPSAAAVILVPELVLLQIWNEREDLQSKFPEVEYGKYDGIRNWAEKLGWNEDERLSKLIPEGETAQYAQMSKTRCGTGTILRDGVCVLDDRCGPGTILQDGVCNLEPSKEPVNLIYSVLMAIILIAAVVIGGFYIERKSRRKKLVPTIILGAEQQLEEEKRVEPEETPEFTAIWKEIEEVKSVMEPEVTPEEIESVESEVAPEVAPEEIESVEPEELRRNYKMIGQYLSQELGIAYYGMMSKIVQYRRNVSKTNQTKCTEK